MNPGVYSDISNAAYHGGLGESKSLLDLVNISPVHYRARKIAANDNEEPREPTPSQRFGTAFHAMLLEPDEFVRSHCLALRTTDVQCEGPLIENRDQLVALVEELNTGRKAKLSTSGSKDDMVTRIMEARDMEPDQRADQRENVLANLNGMKAADLKGIIASLNEKRQGLLSTTGTIPELAQTLRDAGRQVTLWSEVKAQWLSNNGHLTVLTQEEWDELHRMREAVMAHPAARALMTGAPGVAEQSVYWRDPATGLLCRCRPDFWRRDGIVVDLKTCDDASLDGFMRSIAKWRYHVQHPFYLDGIGLMQSQHQTPLPDFAHARPKAFVFLAVERGARVVDGVALGVGVYMLDSESVELGRQEYQRNLKSIAECHKAEKWPGYGDNIQAISLPAWKLKQLAEAA